MFFYKTSTVSTLVLLRASLTHWSGLTSDCNVAVTVVADWSAALVDEGAVGCRCEECWNACATCPQSFCQGALASEEQRSFYHRQKNITFRDGTFGTRRI